jgi:hypothetical protein
MLITINLQENAKLKSARVETEMGRETEKQNRQEHKNHSLCSRSIGLTLQSLLSD